MKRVIVLQPVTNIATEHVGESVFAECQRITGDYIAPVYLGPYHNGEWHLCAYVADNGIALDYPLTRVLVGTHVEPVALFGPVVVVRQRIDDEGESFYADVTDADVAFVDSLMVLPLPITATGGDA